LDLVDASILDQDLRRAIEAGPDEISRWPARDVVTSMLALHALHLEPIERLRGAEEWQHHPDVAVVKGRLEERFRARLEGECPTTSSRDVAEDFRRLAHVDLVPPVYEWLADAADRDDLVEFVALEGGPDADFDDLVAICQVGLSGRPKVTLGANYWDEMGRGELADVHTELHHRMTRALDVPAIPRAELPLEALERKALNGYLATNRSLQPELLGSLGLLECQAGPRCRRVVAAMRRLDVPAGALPFYEEHAVADPRHGKEWIEHAIVPLVERRPDWGPRILRGAWWRATVNRRFFAAMEQRFGLVRTAA
jgi:hypothetical protein